MFSLSLSCARRRAKSTADKFSITWPLPCSTTDIEFPFVLNLWNGERKWASASLKKSVTCTRRRSPLPLSGWKCPRTEAPVNRTVEL